MTASVTRSGSSAVRTRLWLNGQLTAENFPLEDVSARLHDDGALLWADLLNPDRTQLAELADELGFNRRGVDDVVEHCERTKATRYTDHTRADRLRHDSGTSGPGSIESLCGPARCRYSCCPRVW